MSRHRPTLLPARRALLLGPLALALLGSTCVIVEEGPIGGDVPYKDESTEQKMEEEQAEEVITDSER